MLVRPEEWTSRIWRAGEEADRRDYRATEAKVERRLHSWRWFEERRHHCRPSTRDSSQPHAITRQWVHVAHAHLDLSPASREKRPAAKERAGYRQFADSLDERQQFELGNGLQRMPWAHTGGTLRRWPPFLCHRMFPPRTVAS